ncbi:MAG: hypothetical protein CMO45_07055 [Verrucomicrobiales bacterium]|nr:hypothetical protein [Verrucomicrobiales bacterium]|tara:strand:+ start:104 stop:367 length:264 start_codon:yes stop_codon:yes gene_type:complete
MDKLKTKSSKKGCGYWCLLIGGFFLISAFICFAKSSTTAAYSPENYGYFLSGITLGLIGVPLFCIGGLMQLVSWAEKKNIGQGKLKK